MKSPWGTAKRPKETIWKQNSIILITDLGVQVPLVFTPKYRKKLCWQVKRHLGQVFHDLARRKSAG